jgi:hypothetical protein
MNTKGQNILSIEDLATVTGGAGSGNVTFGSPTTITSSPWSNQTVNITNVQPGVRPQGMPMYEFRKLNPGFKPLTNRPLSR